MDQADEDVLDYDDEDYDQEPLMRDLCVEQQPAQATGIAASPHRAAPEPLPRLNTALGAEEGELDVSHGAPPQHGRSRLSSGAGEQGELPRCAADPSTTPCCAPRRPCISRMDPAWQRFQPRSLAAG